MLGIEAIRRSADSPWPVRTGIGAVEDSAAGNIVLRIGDVDLKAGIWEHVSTVVLSPAEARALIEQVSALL